MSDYTSGGKILPAANNATESTTPSNSSAPSKMSPPLGTDSSATTKGDATGQANNYSDDNELEENPSRQLLEDSLKYQRKAEGEKGVGSSHFQEPSSHSEPSALVPQHSKQVGNTDETSHRSPDNEFQSSGNIDTNGSESQNDKTRPPGNVFDSKKRTEDRPREDQQAANYTDAKDRNGIYAQCADGTKVIVRIRLQNALVKVPPEHEGEIEISGFIDDDGFTSVGKSDASTNWKKDFDRSNSKSTNNSVDAENDKVMNYPTGKNEVESSSSHCGSEDEGRTNHHQHHHHPRRGRSSSFDIREAESGLSSRDTSTSSSLPVSTAAAAAAGSGFAEASLLLGIAEGGAKTKETLGPGTLPTAMTSFLDALNDEQRRTRQRYIPTVEGFRKLYKSEIKSDLAMARLSGKKKKKNHERDNVEHAKGDAVDLDDETSVISENDLLSDLAALKEKKAKEAFVFPSESNISLAINGRLASLMENTPFETRLSGKSLNSPQWVESLTAFNPPRPQESIGTKTRHRMKRWERHPKEVEDDLMMYRKTVQRTREELRKAQDEHHYIEAVGSMVRTHFIDHLVASRQELDAIHHQLHGAQSECLKAAELYNPKSVTTRAAVGKSMKDVLSILKSLGEELEGISRNSSQWTASLVPVEDWRVSGVGGISSLSNDDENKKDQVSLARGWILKGDNVITPSGQGEVVSIMEPRLKYSAETLGGSDDENPVITEQVEVRLASGVKFFNPSEIRLLSSQFCTRDSDLATRWQNMIESALKVGFYHDHAGMDSRIHSSLMQLREEELREKGTTETDNTNIDDKLAIDPVNRSASPKSVTQHDDLRSILPFGACFKNAPQTLQNHASIVPLESLESNIRKSVYEKLSNGNRKAAVIPVLPHDVKTFEIQREKLNNVKIEVMQLRNRLSRQKRVRSLNERSLAAGKNRSRKVEGLLSEMQMDLTNLKTRLQDELRELGIGYLGGQPTSDPVLVDGLANEKQSDSNVGVSSVMHGIKSNQTNDRDKDITDSNENATPREFESEDSSTELNGFRTEMMDRESKSHTELVVADNIQRNDDLEGGEMGRDGGHIKAIESKIFEGCRTDNARGDDGTEEGGLKNDDNEEVNVKDERQMEEMKSNGAQHGNTDEKRSNSELVDCKLKNYEDAQLSNNRSNIGQILAKSNENCNTNAKESRSYNDEATTNVLTTSSEGKMPPPKQLKNENQSKIEEMNAGSVAETRPKMYAMTETESKLENHHIQIVLSDVGVSSSDGNNDKHPTTKSVSFFDRNEADATKPAISTTDNGATEKRSSDVADQERESKRQRL